jgi:hypothetical protein
MWEVPRWLVLVENQRQTQPIGHLKTILPNFISAYGLRTEWRSTCMESRHIAWFRSDCGTLTERLLPMRGLVMRLAIVVVAACAPAVTPTPAPTTAPPTASPTPTPTVALPSPTPTPTPSPSPSPSPTGATGTPPPPVCPAQNGGSGAAQAQITAIRVAHDPGFDRVVFEFGPSSVGTYGVPPWSIAVANGFVGTSGRQVPVDGNAFLSVRFSNASTVDPTTGKQTFTETSIRPAVPLVRHVQLIDDFERVMVWGLGLERLVCAKVTELGSPVRLVVDLPTPP